jgi:hypothetical protein
VFEVRVFCEDKKLPDLLWALDGKIVGMPQLLPVRDAKPSRDNTKVVPTGERQTISQIIFDLVKSRGPGNKILTKEIAHAVVANGGGKASPAGYINRLLINKVLKRLEKGVYVITGHTPNTSTDAFRGHQKEKQHG